MPHPQTQQMLLAPRSDVQYHVQAFSKTHNDFLTHFVEEKEDDAHSIAKVLEEGYKGQYKAKAPKVRVVKVARHTVYSEPQEVVKNPATVEMAPTERRRLEKMLADQAKGDSAGRKKPAAAPKKQVVDLRDVDLSSPKKKGK